MKNGKHLMSRNDLTYSEASTNANRVALAVFNECKMAGGTDEVASSKAREAYDKEMCQYWNLSPPKFKFF